MDLRGLMLFIGIFLRQWTSGASVSTSISNKTYHSFGRILKRVSATDNRHVNLSNLSIRRLANYCFDALEKVESLDLSNNYLIRFPPGVFSKMKNLKRLSLSNNPLNEFFNTTSLGLNNLDYLDLSRTQPYGLRTGQLFGMTEFGKVRVDGIIIGRITTTVFENPLVPVAPADEEPTPIVSLYPWGYDNPFMCINTSDDTLTSFGIYEERSDLISCTSWRRVREINDGQDIHVNLYYQNISNIKDDVFETINLVLDELDLERNLFNSTAFAKKLPKRIRSLNLDSNPISIVPLDSFHELKSLEKLDLSNAHVTHIEPGTFRHQKKLKTLLLLNNAISELKPGFFEGLDSLEIINLKGNRITKIPSNLFTGWNHPPRIYYISLYNNPISNIEDGAFTHMNIKLLSVGGNSLGDDGIREGSFNGSTIYRLELMASKITRFNGEWFRSISGLKEITLNAMGVTKIEKGLAKYMKNIITLNLEDTAVEILQNGALYGLSKDKMVSVYVPDHRLKVIERGLFDDL